MSFGETEKINTHQPNTEYVNNELIEDEKNTFPLPINSQRMPVISFGKYKGLPVDVLRSDPSYCEWLMAQDWFTERYPQINTLIINNFTQTDNTPVHNALQARFLEEELALKLCEKLISETTPNYKTALRDKYKRKYQTCIEKQKTNKNEHFPCCQKPTDGCFCYKGANDDIDITIDKTEFEEYGWDVRINATLNKGDPERLQDLEIKIAIEIKPAIGDDYPAVLRQIKSNIYNSRTYFVLIYEEFTANGVSVEQVTEIFKRSGIHMISIATLDNM